MSISASLANAFSGLTAASRAAELVSSNVANATTEGYARRELSLSARTTGSIGSGVTVDGVMRVVDEIVLRDRRLAEAGSAAADTAAAFQADLQALFGVPGEEGALSSRLSAFEAALIGAQSRPDLQARLEAVARTASDLTAGLNAASDGVQGLRRDADAAIARTVEDANATLDRIAEVDTLILRGRGTGQEVSRPSRPASATRGPALRGRSAKGAATREWHHRPLQHGRRDASGRSARRPRVHPDPDDRRRHDPCLGGVVRSDGERAACPNDRGLRPPRRRQARRALPEPRRPGRDGTVAAGRIGARSCGALGRPGGRPDPAARAMPVSSPTQVPRSTRQTRSGLQPGSRVNGAVLPSRAVPSGALRDGLGAAVQGTAGDTSLLSGAVGGTFRRESATFRQHHDGGTLGRRALRRGRFAGREARCRQPNSAAIYRAAQADSLRLAEAAGGVDTDDEMQKLLLIEQIFAANARVIRTMRRADRAVAGDLRQ